MRRARILLVIVVLVSAAWALWVGFRHGPPATITLDSDRPAVGPATKISAHFSEPELGLSEIRLEVVQGERVEELASDKFDQLSIYSPFAKPATAEASLEAVVGRESLPWLAEGEVVVRARASGPSGPLADSESLAELTLPVILRPPQIQVLSTQHYVRQGGAGAVVFLVDERASRSGVRAADATFVSFPRSDEEPQERVCLYGIPFDLDRATEVRIFAEDAAGNRSEVPFLDIFKEKQPATDSIRLGDAFLERVVPAIVSQTPSLPGEGTLLDQYLAINGDLRKANRNFVTEIGSRSEGRRLWEGGFLPLPNARRMAGYAETRSYRYEGREVDVQTHLGLDLASIRRAPVPAAASGIVRHVGFVGIYGNSVLIDHGFGLTTLYAHLSSTSAEPGERVARGDEIGRTGATGLAGGDHLHFGVFVQGVAVDPIEWLDASWIRNRIDPKIPPEERAADEQGGDL